MTLGLPLVFQPYKVRVIYVSEIEGDDKTIVLTDSVPYALCTLRSLPKELIEIRNWTRTTQDKEKGLCFMIVPSAYELQGRYDTEPRFEKTIEFDTRVHLRGGEGFHQD